MRSNLLITDHHLHLLNAGVGVDIVKVWHLMNLIWIRVPHPAPPGELPVHQTQAVHVRPLPTVKHALVDAAVKKLWSHIAFSANLVIEGNIYLAVIKQPDKIFLRFKLNFKAILSSYLTQSPRSAMTQVRSLLTRIFLDLRSL